MSESDFIFCDVNDWASAKKPDSECASDSDSCSSVYDYKESCVSGYYGEIVHALIPPAADDSIFYNDTLVDQEADNKSLTSNRSSNASHDDSDNDPDFNIEDYDSENSAEEFDSELDKHVHSTPETHRIVNGNSCKRALDTDKELCHDVSDMHSFSLDKGCKRALNTDKELCHDVSDVHSFSLDEGCKRALDTDKELCHDASDIASQKSVDLTKSHIKRHVCVYCEKPYAKIVRHYEQKHKNELKVAEALAYPKQSRKRHALWTELRHKGNFAANKPVLANRVGTFIPARRPKNDMDLNDYLPCPHCLGSYKRSTLWRHSKKCLVKSEKDETKGRKISTIGKFLLPVPAECGKSFKLEILAKMKSDSVYYLIVRDALIIKFGERLYARHRDEKHKHAYVKQKMREMGRFLQMFIQNNGPTSLSDAIHGTKFKSCVKAVRDLCSFDDDKGSCGIPSLALKIGQSLTVCALIKKSEAIEADDKDCKEDMKNFLNLYKINWNTDVSSLANRTLHAKSFNKPKRIPLTRDIQKMNKYLEESAQEAEEDLKRATEDKEVILRKLRELTLAQIVLFNRRRGGEAQRIEVQQVKEGFLAKNLNDDVMETLSKFEQKLANTLERFEIRGKRGRRVPVLLTERHKRRVNILLKHHTGNSKYLFPLAEDTTLSTWKILSDLAKECGAERPELLTSTNLRKHVGTVSQILNLQEHELDSIADFLGHDIRVHRQFYRLSDDTIQLAKVSKLLCEMESGNLAKHKNKTLNEIQCTEEEEVDMDEDSDIEGSVQGNLEVTETGRDAPIDEAGASNQQAFSDEEKDDEPLPEKKRQKKRRVMSQRMNWTDEEIEAVFNGLEENIRTRKLPGKIACVNLMREYPCLHRRSWTHIKFFVKNHFDKKPELARKS